MCATRPGFGPGTPCYEDAPAGFAEALTILDFSPTTDVRRAAALDTVLAGARAKDALTLVAPAVPRHPRGARPGLRSDGRPGAAAARGHARGHRPRRRQPRSATSGGASWGSTARRGGASGSPPGNSAPLETDPLTASYLPTSSRHGRTSYRPLGPLGPHHRFSSPSSASSSCARLARIRRPRRRDVARSHTPPAHHGAPRSLVPRLPFERDPLAAGTATSRRRPGSSRTT